MVCDRALPRGRIREVDNTPMGERRSVQAKAQRWAVTWGLLLVLGGGGGCATLSGEPERGLGYLEVDCSPRDATIVIDGEQRGNLALWRGGVVPIDAGHHRVEIVHAGYFPYQFDLDVEAGRSVRLGLDLIKEIEDLDDLDDTPSSGDESADGSTGGLLPPMPPIEPR